MKNEPLFLTITILILTLSMGCKEPAEKKIIGSWQIDSIYDNHNGFTFTNRNPYPKEVYEYKEDKTVLRKGMGEQLEYRYLCRDTLLKISNTRGTPAGEFIIVHLSKNQLALKTNKKSTFPGKNELRYEIRYFSRVDSGPSPR